MLVPREIPEAFLIYNLSEIPAGDLQRPNHGFSSCSAANHAELSFISDITDIILNHATVCHFLQGFFELLGPER